MCYIIEESRKDNWDATNSWSGYNYQGKIALYLGIQKINELILNGKEDLEKYSVEIEWLEDFSIVYTDAATRVYQSIHQVKAKENTSIKDYEDALIKLYQKIEKDNLIINAYLHVCRALDYKGSTWKESIETIIKNCNQIKELKSKIEDYKNCNKDIKQKQSIQNSNYSYIFYQGILEIQGHQMHPWYLVVLLLSGGLLFFIRIIIIRIMVLYFILTF